MQEIQAWLFAHQDPAYKSFGAGLIPELAHEKMIGVRTPALRSYAKQLIQSGQAEQFIQELPHTYFEENQLHAFILCEMRDYAALLRETERFLPWIDNWATCDQFRPKIFRKHTETLRASIAKWLQDDHPYTVRFALGMLNSYYLDEHFDRQYLEQAAAVRSDAYYVNMMLAWLFATALTKQYDETLPYFTEGRLDRWVHNKAIQKARESRRVPDDIKEYLKTLKH